MKRYLMKFSMMIAATAIAVASGCDSNPPEPVVANTTSERESAITQPPAAASNAIPESPATSPEQPEHIKPTDVAPVAEATPPSDETLPPATEAPGPDAKVATFSGLTGPKPATWMPRPITNERASMVAAEYSVPGRDGFDMARLTVYHRLGGTPEENIQRWKLSQFRTADQKVVEPKIERFEVEGMSVTLAEFNGEFKGTGSVNFSPDHTLLAAIIPNAPPGQIILYFAGPTGTIEPNREAFLNLVRNLRRVDAQK